MLLLHFTELGLLALLARNCLGNVGVELPDSEGDISEDARSSCGLDSRELCIVTCERSLRQLVGEGEQTPTVVDVALPSGITVVPVDALSVGPNVVVGRDASESVVATLLENATLTGDKGQADDGGRVVDPVALEGVVDDAPENVTDLLAVRLRNDLGRLRLVGARWLSSLLEDEGKDGSVLPTRRGEFLFLRKLFFLFTVVAAVDAVKAADRAEDT